MTQSDKIKARLRRLLAMTTDNGASEAEALAAAEAASRLMHEHNLSYRTIEDIDADAFGNDTRPWFTGAKGRRKSAPVPKVMHCLPGIERLCGVKHLFSTFDGSLTFFGAACDTEVAHYLTSIISRAMDREWHTYQQRIPKGMARTKRASFYLGIGARISSRLIAMADEQKPSATSGAGLVLVKDALVKERFEKANPTLRNHGVTKVKDAHSVNAGWNAGGNVALNKGVNEALGAAALPTPEGAA